MPPNTHALILHLSDLHFGWDGDDFLKIAQRTVALREMLRVISALEDSWRPNVLCITGDIGWRGKQEDYALAKTWINELLATLRFGSEALFLCPGNHDSDRNFALSNVRPADRTDAERVLKSPLAEQYTRPFASFATFCREIGVPAYRVGELDSYLVGSRLFSGLNFVCLNSAWFSQGDDDKGRL